MAATAAKRMNSPSTSAMVPPTPRKSLIPVHELRQWDLFKDVDLDILKSVRLAYVAGFGWSKDSATGFLVTDKDDVYSVGSNINGVLGIGSAAPSFSSNPVKVKTLCGKSVAKFANGGSRSDSNGAFFVALTVDGGIYTWGANQRGQLGLGEEARGRDIMLPTRISVVFLASKRSASTKTMIFEQIACGQAHSLALTSLGKLFAWGDDSKAQLGMKRSNASKFFSAPWLSSTITYEANTVKSIACGVFHSAAIMNDGRLFVWGSDERGQLGNDIMIDDLDANTATNSRYPVIPALEAEAIAKVCCGAFHVLALSTDGKMFAWGDGSLGQLGVTGFNVTSPREYSFELVEDIAVAPLGHFNACKTKYNNYYVWGNIIGDYDTPEQEDNDRPTMTACPIIPVPFKSFPEIFRFYAPSQETYQVLSASSPRIRSPLSNFEMGLIHPEKGVTDIVFIVQEKMIHAHKAVLKMNSEYFTTMLSPNWEKTNNNNTITIGGNIRYETFFSLLYYIYVGEVYLQQTSLQNFADLMSLADYYLMPDLSRRCEEMLEQMMTAENVVELYNIAQSAPNMKTVGDFAFKFMVKNWKLVGDTDTVTKLSYNDLAKLFKEAAKNA